VRLRLSAKGLELYAKMSAMFARQIEALGDSPIGENDLKTVVKQLQSLEQFWTRQMNVGVRRAPSLSVSAA
jgi:hypothetical protein